MILYTNRAEQHDVFPFCIICGKFQHRCNWSFPCVPWPVSSCVYWLRSLTLCSFTYPPKFPAQTERHHLHHKLSDSYHSIRLPLYQTWNYWLDPRCNNCLQRREKKKLQFPLSISRTGNKKRQLKWVNRVMESFTFCLVCFSVSVQLLNKSNYCARKERKKTPTTFVQIRVLQVKIIKQSHSCILETVSLTTNKCAVKDN